MYILVLFQILKAKNICKTLDSLTKCQRESCQTHSFRSSVINYYDSDCLHFVVSIWDISTLKFVRLVVFAVLTAMGIMGVLPGHLGDADACPSGRPTGDLVVALRHNAVPFTDFNDSGRATGFNVALWKEVADTLRVPDGQGGFRKPEVNLIECDKINRQEAALVAGNIDIVISPLTITSARMQKYDFSQQYISSGLSVAVPARSAIDFTAATKIIRETVFSSTVAAAIIAFLTFNLILAALIRWILFSPEDQNAGGAFGSWIRAILEAFMRTFGLQGINGEYRSAISKIFEIFMAIVGTALSATILGVLTSAFVGSVGSQSDLNARQLASMRVATIHCSTAQTLLRQQYEELAKGIDQADPQSLALDERINALFCTQTSSANGIPEIETISGLDGEIKLVDSWASAMALLAAGKVDAVLGDWVALTYLSRQNYEGQIDVLPSYYRNEPYGWGISRTSVSEDIRRDIDRALISNMRDATWRAKLEGALGAGAVSPN